MYRNNPHMINLIYTSFDHTYGLFERLPRQLLFELENYIKEKTQNDNFGFHLMIKYKYNDKKVKTIVNLKLCAVLHGEIINIAIDDIIKSNPTIEKIGSHLIIASIELFKSGFQRDQYCACFCNDGSGKYNFAEYVPNHIKDWIESIFENILLMTEEPIDVEIPYAEYDSAVRFIPKNTR